MYRAKLLKTLAEFVPVLVIASLLFYGLQPYLSSLAIWVQNGEVGPRPELVTFPSIQLPSIHWSDLDYIEFQLTLITFILIAILANVAFKKRES